MNRLTKKTAPIDWRQHFSLREYAARDPQHVGVVYYHIYPHYINQIQEICACKRPQAETIVDMVIDHSIKHATKLNNLKDLEKYLFEKLSDTLWNHQEFGPVFRANASYSTAVTWCRSLGLDMSATAKLAEGAMQIVQTDLVTLDTRKDQKLRIKYAVYLSVTEKLCEVLNLSQSDLKFIQKIKN